MTDTRDNGTVQQFNGRESETATFLKRSLVNSELRVIGFALRPLNRDQSTASGSGSTRQ